MNLLYDGLQIFLGILFEALPFILMGVAVSAVLHVFVPSDRLLRWLPKSVPGRMVFASMLGFLFPVCECGNIPVAKRLMGKGLPPYVALMFLLAAPVVNPIVLLATWAAFRGNPEVVVWRVVLTLIIAWTVGWAFRHATFDDVAAPALKIETKDHQHHHRGKLGHFLETALRETGDMLGVLMIGAVLASVIQLLLPRGVLLALAGNTVASIFSMEALAFIVSICSNVDAFFILGLSTNIGMPAIIAFLVFGPMVDIKALVMLSRVFRSRVLVALVALTSLMTAALALLLAYIL